jgi:hypothetical protein
VKSCLITAISQPIQGFLALKPTCSGNWYAPVPIEKSKSYTLALPQKDWTCVLFHSGADLAADWDTAAPKDNLFLSKTYLSALEQYAPEGMKFAYGVFYFQEKPVGVACCQLLTFNAAEHVQGLSEPGRNIAQWLKQRVAASTKIPLLIFGNMLLTGDHAFYFNAEYADGTLSAQLLGSAAGLLCNGNVIPGFEASATLIKDFEAQHAPFTTKLREGGFHEIPFQPNMRMALRPEWQKFDDYIEAMSSKYRVRARRAFRKLDGVERRELNLDAVKELDVQLHTLYCSVARHADFNMITLHPQYFSGLKAALEDRFRIWGYFLDGALLGFHSAIYNGDELEAHFLGFQDIHNADFQLYLNMLYDMVREAFAAGASQIVFSRTATEIKSSIGAEAFETYCYLRHCNPVVHAMTQALVGYLAPKETWTPRHPFREGEPVV